MNIRLSRGTRLLSVPVAVLHACMSAWAQSPHAGTWEAREFSIKEAAIGCRYVEAVTATFQLTAGLNNAVAGILTRRFERTWWDANPSCAMPGVNTNPNFTLRQDMWAVSGEPQGKETQRLKGIYAGCSTDCREPWSAPATFDIQFTRRPGGMSSGLLKGIVGTTMFRDSYQLQVDSANAAEAFIPLLRPLQEGRCDEFLLRSVDAAWKQRFSRDLICAFGATLTQLAPTVVRDEKSQALAPTLAQVKGMSGPLLLSEGEVLVQRFLVVNAAGNGVVLAGVLRRQEDGSWKLRDLVP